VRNGLLNNEASENANVEIVGEGITDTNGEIRISKASLIHIPKWVVIFKAKESIYVRRISAASNTKLMDELEYCSKHFSRWQVWEGKIPSYAICDVCGEAYCEDHISKVNDVYLCEEHMKS
jgi:hypothetical protein